MYEKINMEAYGSDVQIVDLRSDTLSKPTQEMREAMATAVVGDDCYGEDPTVTELEKRAAELVGKEAGLFVASGTMSNLLAIMVHCNQRGSEIISGDKGHTFLLEQGGSAAIAGAQTCTLKTKEDGTFSLDELREKIRKNPEDAHQTRTTLIIIENTHNLCGGRVLPLDWLEKLSHIAEGYNIPVHMDGARVMNAAVYLKTSPKRVCRDVDSVSFCLSKGLGAPVGSILAGSEKFIRMARRYRKMIGGGWRQAGIIAAAGLVSLNKMIDRLQVDHDHTLKIAKAIYSMKSNLFKVDLPAINTNILVMYVDHSKVPIRELQRRLQTVNETDQVKVSVRCMSMAYNCVRFVVYWQISESDVEMVIEKLQLVIREYDEKFKLIH